MNSRVIILGVAALAACIAMFLVSHLLGGGTEKAVASLPPPARPATTQVLVAARDLQPGTALTPDAVRWQEWPKSSVDSSFITSDQVSDSDNVIKGTVVRAPLVSGEPLTATKMVHADAAGIMAAMVEPGERAVSIGISTETGAGGFILPNDRVDVVLTRQVSDATRKFSAKTILSDVRVLAVDQTFQEDKDQKVVLAKTATLEVSPGQAEKLEGAQASGTISLMLRPLGENAAADAHDAHVGHDSDTAATIIRYGVETTSSSALGE